MSSLSSTAKRQESHKLELQQLLLPSGVFSSGKGREKEKREKKKRNWHSGTSQQRSSPPTDPLQQLVASGDVSDQQLKVQEDF